jgi:hypothetical protein
MALFNDNFLCPLDPCWIFVIASRQSLWQCWRQDIERLLYQSACVWLESAQQCNVDLQDNFGRRVVHLDEATHIHVGTLFALCVFALQMIPGELNELFAVLNELFWNMLDKQRCELQQFYPQRFFECWQHVAAKQGVDDNVDNL